TESVLLAAAGAALGLVFGFWATRGLATSLTSILPLHVNFTAVPDVRVLAATIGFAVLSTIAFGLGPALRLSRRDLVTDLKDRSADGAGSGRRFSARNIMVVAQVSLSLAMLTAGGIFAKTAVNASRTGPGYSYDQLLIASLDGGIGGYDVARSRTSYRDILTRLRETPGMQSATVASSVAFGDTREGETLERIAGEYNIGVDEFRIIGTDYFKTLGVPMVRGREFTQVEEQSPDAPRVAIIDVALARELFGADDPIGQMIRAVREPGRPASGRQEPMQIVGIAPEMRVELLRSEPSSHLYVPLGREFRANMFVQARLAPGIDDAAGLDVMRGALRQADPGMPVLSLATMHAVHDKGIELWALRTGAKLFTLLGGVALLLAVVGVYGVKSYVVSQRTREIGIRMALGADARAVLTLMLKDGMLLTAVGVLIGVPLAVAVSMLMASVFVDLGGFDASVVSVATLVLALAATIATVIPSRRAARIEPLRALRAE
ncbi:MAG: ABC transporter permease, partial [Acidobacteria bacterium]|nr:ABC transporter permease [Acidobacteriota bacterium]